MGYKARVLDIKGDKAVVFTSKAEFKRIPLKNKNLRIGDEIPMSVAFFTKASKITKMGLAAAAMAAVFLITMLVAHNPAQAKVARYYTVDINPSIELAADANDTIISAEGQNEDGTKLLENLDLQGMQAEDAITAIAEEAAQQGFIKPDQENDIVVTVTDVADGNAADSSGGDGTAVTSDSGDGSATTSDSSDNPAVTSDGSDGSAVSSNNGDGSVAGDSSDSQGNIPDENDLTDKINQALASDRLSVKVSVLETKEEQRQLAKEEGISVGKYVILAAAQKEGLNITVDDIKTQSIRKAVEAAGGDFKAIVLEAKRDSNLGQAMKAFNQQRKAAQSGSSEQSQTNQNEESGSTQQQTQTNQNEEPSSTQQQTQTNQNEEPSSTQQQTQIQQSTQTSEQKANAGQETMIQERNQVQVKEDVQAQQENGSKENGSNKKPDVQLPQNALEQKSNAQQKNEIQHEAEPAESPAEQSSSSKLEPPGQQQRSQNNGNQNPGRGNKK